MPEKPKIDIRHDLKEMDIAHHSGDFQNSWRNVNLPIEALNVFEHWSYFKDVSKRTPFLMEDRCKEPKPCIVIGSGPSLDNALPYLKDWKHAIISSSSQLTTMAYYDVYPTYFASPDPKGHIEELTALPPDKLDKLHETTTFVQAPIGPYLYTDTWKGRIRWFLIFDPGKEWYANAIAPNFTWIPESLLPFSANVPALVAIAQYLNFAPLYLVGADFAGKRYDNWMYDGEWKESKGTTTEGNLGYQKNYLGQHTDMNMQWAWRGMLCTLRLAINELKGVRWHIYLCSQESALKEQLPYRDIKDVISRQGENEKMNWSKQKTRTAIDIALARFNTFCFGFHNGQDWGERLEMATSWEELGQKIDSINGMLQQTLNLYTSLDEAGKKEALKAFKPDKVKPLDKAALLDYCRFLKERTQ